MLGVEEILYELIKFCTARHKRSDKSVCAYISCCQDRRNHHREKR
uniref:Uncharacterized protein n=1 Tax=Timema shepardi TaxID=629360 RepID=A0A7R9B924_TIMSH|nr:unnamed protein product [Timema shepardi]